MSLINQVLKDIDQRRSAEFSDSKTDLDDLHFAHIPKRKRKSKSVIIVSLATFSVVAIVLAGLYVFQQLKPMAVDVQVREATNPPAAVVTAPIPATPARKPAVSAASSTPDSRSERKSGSQSKSRPKPETSAKVTPAMPAEVADASKTETLEEPIDNTPVKFSRSTVPMRPEQKAELSYQNGYAHLRGQRNRQAEQSLRRALDMESGHVKARELLSGIYIKQGRWVEASELLREGLTYSPEHRTFSKLYARALMQLNRDVQAIAVLKRYAPPVKSDPYYFAILAALYQRQDQHNLAAEVYATLVSIEPSNGVWWVGLGISLEALGRNQDAVQAYGHASKTGNLRSKVARFTNNRLLALEELNFPLE